MDLQRTHQHDALEIRGRRRWGLLAVLVAWALTSMGVATALLLVSLPLIPSLYTGDAFAICSAIGGVCGLAYVAWTWRMERLDRVEIRTHGVRVCRPRLWGQPSWDGLELEDLDTVEQQDDGVVLRTRDGRELLLGEAWRVDDRQWLVNALEAARDAHARAPTRPAPQPVPAELAALRRRQHDG